MQKIFYNANIITFDAKLPNANAFLVNDESIVLVGSNEEVLEMKGEDSEVIDLLGKTVIPTFFDTNAKIYDLIELNIKNANKAQFLENNAEIDENYEKFDNFEYYKEEFLKIQDEYLKNGMTTIFEMGVNNKEFIFWKKLSESNLLKLDVIAYIDMLTSKDVMDNNCRSYRKYKNNFRIGGYLIKIDGKLSEKKAWISKKYKKEKSYRGYTNVVDEQLSVLIKASLDEKKQLVVETNGDEALSQFLRCFEENVKDKKEEELFRPIAKNCNLASKNQISTMKKLHVSPSFEINEISENGHIFKRHLGYFRSKNIQIVNKFAENGFSFLLNSSKLGVPNIFDLIYMSNSRIYKNGKIFNVKQKLTFERALMSMIKYSAYFAFDDMFKGSIENGFRADFLVLDYKLSEIKEKNITSPVSEVYIKGKKAL